MLINFLTLVFNFLFSVSWTGTRFNIITKFSHERVESWFFDILIFYLMCVYLYLITNIFTPGSSCQGCGGQRLISRSQRPVNIEILRAPTSDGRHQHSATWYKTRPSTFTQTHAEMIKTRHLMQILPRLVPNDDHSPTDCSISGLQTTVIITICLRIINAATRLNFYKGFMLHSI